MKIIFTLLIVSFSYLGFGQISEYSLQKSNGDLLVSVIFSQPSTGGAIVDNGNVWLFIPNELTDPVVTSIQGGGWVISNTVDVASTCGSSDLYYAIEITPTGTASLGSIIPGVPENLFSVSFTGTSNNTINPLNWGAVDAMSDCFLGLGVGPTITFDLDGNSADVFISTSEDPSVGPSIILPIRLQSFTAKKFAANTSLLEWTTASEDYRLKLVDNDESFVYSEVRSVTFDNNGIVSLEAYPNPSTEVINLRMAVGETNTNTAQMMMLDMTGKLVKKQTVSANGISVLEVDQLETGVYNIIVKHEDKTYQKRVIKTN